MPNGARCAVQVYWKGGKGAGHVFIAENHKGKVYFIDPQKATEEINIHAERHFKDASGEGVCIARLDKLKFSDIVREACRPNPDRR